MINTELTDSYNSCD